MVSVEDIRKILNQPKDTTMKTLKNRSTLRSTLDLTVAGHMCIMEAAAEANARMLAMDERADKYPEGKLSISRRYCGAGLDDLQKSMLEQRDRLNRAVAELQVIRKNIQTI